MNEAVIDASVIVKWYVALDEDLKAEAHALRRRHEEADLNVVVPSILFLEILNVAGRRWRWEEPALLDLSAELEGLQVEVASPDLSAIATWTSRGLSAYDAAYVALAEGLNLPLVTHDTRVLSLAGGVAIPLSQAR